MSTSRLNTRSGSLTPDTPSSLDLDILVAVPTVLGEATEEKPEVQFPGLYPPRRLRTKHVPCEYLQEPEVRQVSLPELLLLSVPAPVEKVGAKSLLRSDPQGRSGTSLSYRLPVHTTVIHSLPDRPSHPRSVRGGRRLDPRWGFPKSGRRCRPSSPEASTTGRTTLMGQGDPSSLSSRFREPKVGKFRHRKSLGVDSRNYSHRPSVLRSIFNVSFQGTKNYTLQTGYTCMCYINM